MEHKACYGKCERCVWFRNGGCSEWNGLLKGVWNDIRESYKAY